MTDGQLRREFGQHLIEEVLAGRMTRRELLTRASIFGLSATAIGSLLPACGSSMSASAVSAYTNPDSCLLATSGWVRQGIILRGTPGAWDYTIGEVSIIHDSGIWKMRYMGAEPGVLAAIGYATAPSLAGPWTKNTEGTPVPLTVLTPGFQTDGNSDGVADNWTVYKNVGGTPTFSLATGHTGSFAQRIQYTAQAGDTGKQICLFQLVAGSVGMYDLVNATVYAKGSVTGGCTVEIDPVIEGSNQDNPLVFTPTGAWQEYGVDTVVTAAGFSGNVVFRAIRVVFASDVGSVDITIDDVTLIKYANATRTNPLRSLLGRDHGSVFKIGETYHFWGVTDGTNFLHKTSTDGLAWSGDDTALSAGTWDPLMANPCVWQDGSGAWYMFYEGYNNITLAGIGVATASSPTGPWTKHGSGPVLGGPGVFEACRPWVLQIHGTCYMWFHGGFATRYPDDICRAHATNPLGPWTVDASPLLARTGYDEGEGLPNSQIGDVRVLSDGVEGYMFYTANRDFNGAVAPSYIKLATSPARHRN